MLEFNPKCIIICVDFKKDNDFTEMVSEGVALTVSYGYDVVEIVTLKRDRPDAGLFIGSGKADEIKSQIIAHEVATVVINHNITSAQLRNLEKKLEIRVIDRTQLILDIFASRVTSNEGILQVELAQLSHQITRLVGRWTHLERQGGGDGWLGGPGETQAELDKRMINEKIKIVKRRLNLSIKQRETQRKSRLKNSIASLSIVGYTNAGKSTLFNTLTKSNVYVEDRLFATLSTTSRKMFLNDNSSIIISDTVGFIRDLPHGLVAAFRATLEETIHATLLLHVVDINNIIRERQIEDVDKVLVEIEAIDTPQLIIYNKIDLQEEFIIPHIEYDANNQPIAVYVSAIKNQGLDLLRQAIAEKLYYINNNKVKTQQELVYEPWKN